jgi:hypothetical protein
MMDLYRIARFVVLPLVVNLAVSAQTGGTYLMEKSVVSPAGGISSGGTLSLHFTVGQPLAGGPLQGVGSSVYLGFWVPQLEPTAAAVTLSGQVRNVYGQGVKNVLITLTSQSGDIQHARTSSFGYYSFYSVTVGATYFVTAEHKRLRIQSPVRVISVIDQVDDVDFIAIEP